jgi:hypothetical protein
MASSPAAAKAEAEMRLENPVGSDRVFMSGL